MVGDNVGLEPGPSAVVMFRTFGCLSLKLSEELEVSFTQETGTPEAVRQGANRVKLREALSLH